ncbi:hypothetical protein PUNSTDRAFT_55035 [Punctularia strigosozonata HHB-11173 SS5]|uniref:Ubinuclein middle domain-containing protein n=1 Tax=Punctularia strigosozonata (strain HHB-11173) TaxID=741275 RepID=R7S5V2_PUNST|nr:uncharacterized protein PUNSTDRAFT_55035 [Punctularia strigosozonata HHB-11173 SS5]EIN05111.1 hypothetical protein PUNSTDRAFT_55035 [Punctularia strigosozonata HHB-11173 SS5]
MSTDVEMLPDVDNSPPSPQEEVMDDDSASNSPSQPSSEDEEPGANEDEDDEDDEDEDGDDSSASEQGDGDGEGDGDEGEPELEPENAEESIAVEEPATAAPDIDASASASSAPNKPLTVRKKRKPRSPSPVAAPPPPPPLPTIRLSIKLGGPSKYEVDVVSLAKSTGQLPKDESTVPTIVNDVDDEAEDEGAKAKDAGVKSEAEGVKSEGEGKRRRRRKPNNAHYDLNDPFIDDSDLAIDERSFIAQTKMQGFYVSAGEVALLKEKTPKKPHSRKPLLLPLPPPSQPMLGESSSASAAGPSRMSPNDVSYSMDGTRDSPIAVPSDGEDDKHGLKRKASDSVQPVSWGPSDAKSGKKRKGNVDIRPFHPELQVMIDRLKVLIAMENWEKKGKFPQSLKPHLAALAIKAIRLNEYDDNFFNLMPTIFPYNRFTMAKLIKRTVMHDHIRILVDRQEVLLAELRQMAVEGFPKAQEEHERAVANWERKQQQKHEASHDSVPASAEGTPVPTPSQGPGQNPDESMKDEKSHPPPQKYKLTEAMKNTIWALVCISNECCRIENEKNQLEGVVTMVSDQGLRKALYQKIVAAFPEGWMTSGQISREMSILKKKYEKEDKMDQDD